MARINSLTKVADVAEINGADVVPIASAANGDDRGLPFAKLLAWLQANLSFPTIRLTQQYSAPSASGFTVEVAEADSWLVLTPVGAFSVGTVTMPLLKTSMQVVTVSSTQAITSLSVLGNGTSIVGAPTTLAANGFFTMAYDVILDTWRRVS